MAAPRSRFAQLLAGGQLGRAVGARTQRLAPTGIDVELLDAADRALTARIPLAVVNPVPGGAAAVALAAGAVVRAALHRGQLDVRVAACSSTLADRALYDQLAFRGQRLADMVPRARIAPDGTITVVGAAGAAPGRLFLAADAARILPLLDTLEAVVVDAGAVDEGTFALLVDNSRRRAPLIYLTGDPGDARLADVRAGGGVVWSWDAPTLGRLARPVSAAPSGADAPPPLLAAPATLTAAGSSTVAVHIPTSPSDLDDALAQLWVALGQLGAAIRAAGGDPVALRGLWWARGVFNALALLPVTPARYDQHVGGNPYALTLLSAPGIARQYTGHARRGTRDAWAQVAGAIGAAVIAAADTPRTPALIRATAVAAESRARAALVVRNRTAAAALRAALRESPHTPLGWDRTVDVIGLEQLVRVAHRSAWDEMYLPGTLPRAHAAVLAAPPTGRLHVLTCGPREGARAVRQAVAARATLAELCRETVELSAPRLGVAAAVSAVDDHPADAVSVIEDDIERALSGEEAAAVSNPWDPFTVDILALLAAVRASGHAAAHSSAGHDPRGSVEIVTVYLDEADTGERAALLAGPNDLLTRRRGLEVRRIAAKALDDGDTVVLVDRGARRDLRDVISAKLAERPEFAALTGFIDLWHERAALAGQTSGLTYREILARMPGTAITYPGTIGNWVNAVVDGPADGDDITRFARAVGDETLERYAPQVVWALRTMHSVDRKLGHWLASRVDAAAASTGNAVVDAELGVHLADLLESVTDHVVVEVDSRPGRYAPADVLGILLPARQADDTVAECTAAAAAALAAGSAADRES